MYLLILAFLCIFFFIYFLPWKGVLRLPQPHPSNLTHLPMSCADFIQRKLYLVMSERYLTNLPMLTSHISIYMQTCFLPWIVSSTSCSCTPSLSRRHYLTVINLHRSSLDLKQCCALWSVSIVCRTKRSTFCPLYTDICLTLTNRR